MLFGNMSSMLRIALPWAPRLEPGCKLSLWRTPAGQLIFLAFLWLSIIAHSICQESNVVRYAKEGDRALGERDYDLAIADYKEVLKINPSSAAAWSNLGAAWFAKNNISQASSSFLRAARLQPANRDYAFNAGLALVREDKCDTAQSYLTTSLASAQRRAPALYLQGLCAFVSKNWQEAKDVLLSAEAGGNRTAETYYMLTIASRESRDPNQAKRAFELLRTTSPTSSLLHELLGEASDLNYTSIDAQKEMSLAIADSHRAPGLHLKLGFLLWKAQQMPEAEKLFDQELAIDPHSYSAMHYLGDIAEQKSQIPQALKWYERALQELPESGEAHFAVGRVLALEGRDEDALRELQASFPALENNASAHYWTAKVLRKLGKQEQASLELSRVREINKADRDVLLTKLSDGER